MNAWDCPAGQFLEAEAGGCVEDQDAQELITRGGRLICGAPGTFDKLVRLTEQAAAGAG